ncbi:uncharacterized protein [Euwallacea similis]|uniref:uncharacterized protein n=1 Tax=Euwallacea similis TaxID=1736056 RepID=UPI0034501BE2
MSFSPSLYFKLMLVLTLSHVKPDELSDTFNISGFPPTLELENCPPFLSIEHGKSVFKILPNGTLGAIVMCHENYTLIGPKMAQCIDGDWKFGSDEMFPRCGLRCSPPPYLEHGTLSLQKRIDDVYSPSGSYSEGTIVSYNCDAGFTLEPEASSIRVCDKGFWTGADAYCRELREMSCPRPPRIQNGYTDFLYNEPALVGFKISYECNAGYRLVGSETIMCNGEGIWVPEAPSCVSQDESGLGLSNRQCSVEDLLSPEMQVRMHLNQVSTTLVEVSCRENYQDFIFPCSNAKFYCEQGKWKGIYPRCGEAFGCKSPPSVSYSLAINRNFETSYDPKGNPFCPFKSQVSYECLKGYMLEGSSVITCQSNGCWEATEGWPRCVRIKENNYFVELNNINALLISSATGAGVLGVLLFACIVVACKKQRSLARAVTLPSPVGGLRRAPDVVNDHTVLLQHPDRLALIAFADGVPTSQNTSLPTYDEATRDTSTLIQVSRLQIQRPHWPSLTVCRTSNRNRNSPNIDPGHHVARQGSFASHTPSMRSGGGESMGSTETVTISEGSTNITLDTASSHSALSQNPSCRGHCGSLASFDGCSIANTEGIPLLEENDELEEAQGSANNEAHEAAALSDSASCKVSTVIINN